MMPKSINARTVVSVLIGMSAGSAMAEVVTPEAYMIDGRGVVARSGYNLCWRTAEWTPAKAIAECDPDLVPKAEPAPAPAPVAAAPKPAPVAPPPPKCEFGAALAADTTFAFGKSDLTPAAKTQLDAIVKDAGSRCGKVSTVHVTGHTDRIGSVKGNQKLSERRATEVKTYLQSKGLNATTFDAVGVGASQPLASVNCGAKMSKAKLVTCLAPNRRVIVDIRGTDK
jgi:OmpA-OmpF porin, OOP family